MNEMKNVNLIINFLRKFIEKSYIEIYFHIFFFKQNKLIKNINIGIKYKNFMI